MPREAKAENLDIPEWRQRLAGIDQQLAGTDRGAARLVFIGDSLTQSWDKGVFDQAFGQYAPVNLGLWGDFTQGALYRLGPGHQWDGFRPRLAVLLIGTNNGQWGGKPADTALGVAEIVRLVRARSPDTKVLILGILPRGADGNEPLRAVNAAVNQQVQRCADGRSVFYLDAGPALLEPDGKLLNVTAFDGLHLTPAGYSRLAAVLGPEVQKLMGQ